MSTFIYVIVYLCFIALGLPDSVFGAAWPSMYPQFGVPVSWAGAVSMTIAAGTVVSSLMSDRLLKKFGIGTIAYFSVGLTCLAVFGFSFVKSYPLLFLFAIPYGLGAGSIDAAVNNFAALYFPSKHMSWLNCMWGIGTIFGPYMIGFGLNRGLGWQFGYRAVGSILLVFTVCLIFASGRWTRADVKKNLGADQKKKKSPLKSTLKIKGAIEILIAFFCYSAVEQTTMLWASSYMKIHNSMSEAMAASFASMFFIGITAGRAVNGFLAIKFSDTFLIRLGEGIIASGIIIMMLPFENNYLTLIGLIIIGLGCAPVYPCIIHSTPEHFGEENVGALVGVQMAFAYTGTTTMPPLFGLISNRTSVSSLPYFLLFFLVLLTVMHEIVVRKTKKT